MKPIEPMRVLRALGHDLLVKMHVSPGLVPEDQ
jgi:hypothetical protein